MTSNRQQRRASARSLDKGKATGTPARPATQADAKRFIDQAFEDRIAWVASRTLLERVLEDPASPGLDDGLRSSIAIFLKRHPEPAGVQLGQPSGGESA